MTLAALLASALLLQPVLDAETDLRLAASDTDGHAVDWYLDGARIATTASGEAVTVPFDAGSHDLWATTAHDGTWRALARPDPASGDGAVTFVDGWSATHAPKPDDPTAPWPVLLAIAGAAVMIVGRRRPKRP